MAFNSVHFLIFLLGLQQLDAMVSIFHTGTRIGDKHFKYGEKIILTCQIDDYPGSMSWQNDSSNVPFANCFTNMCDLDPTVADKYEFLADTNRGTFSLTFSALKYNDNTTYTCSDGLASDCFLVLIKGSQASIAFSKSCVILVLVIHFVLFDGMLFLHII